MAVVVCGCYGGGLHAAGGSEFLSRSVPRKYLLGIEFFVLGVMSDSEATKSAPKCPIESGLY